MLECSDCFLMNYQIKVSAPKTACHFGEFSHQIALCQDPGFPVGKECYGG